MKNEIRKTSIPFDINPKHIYNEISEEIGLICPGYSSIKSQISRYIKKQLPPDISKFNEIPDESEYYINERDENFMIFKNSNIIIFQSPFQTELFIKYNENMFADGTFYIAPIFDYQLHQKFCIVILKKVYPMLPLKYFLILLLNIVYGIIKDR
ncbi:hypothetical protein LY90DRAFT_507243 [Neocallimastix californiae]|uniref:Uncharacterized protein n=1 Tax=Neocallimastix californiae TaxID=1754190 RepID=A0A1Y2D7H7_9FUNG|nr:hypothetical protein LY90DRAFT_507243 [Neocallimastix californiae]|eukprot:ORY55231.1 hypothetical protein LY90DRAFT_507243 [Neocallimastix californiae]